jgi:hypothetical protein
MDSRSVQSRHQAPWNKGRLTGQKAPLKQKEIWAIRVHLQLAHGYRVIALFLDRKSSLRGELRV